MKRPWRLFKDLGLKLEFGKDEARAWELHQTLCEFVEEIGWDFLYVFALCSWERGSYWVLLAFVFVPSHVVDIVVGGFRCYPILYS